METGADGDEEGGCSSEEIVLVEGGSAEADRLFGIK